MTASTYTRHEDMDTRADGRRTDHRRAARRAKERARWDWMMDARG